MFGDLLPWFLFCAFVLAMLALDLFVLHREAHEVSKREALGWSVFWIGLALAFAAGVFVVRGTDDGVQWITGYVIEKSLSVDNVFVFILIFAAFTLPAKYQHRVLFWGVVGAIVFRMAFILAGAALLEAFHVTIYLFGALLILTGLKFVRDAIKKHEPAPIEHNFIVRIARRVLPLTDRYEGQKFFVRRNRKLLATPLFLVLLVIEASDIMFAVDSIPAIFAITDDTFIVFTSNVFAILGLRALYFLLAGTIAELRFLKPALATILVFVGMKMLLSDVYKVEPLVSLLVIVGILAIATYASIRWPGGTARAAQVARATPGPS